MFALAAAARAEALIELGRAPEAKEGAERALALCAECKITVLSHAIVRALAVAEAKVGDYAGGSTRLEGLIREQTALGVTGLHLGATYEARARIAIWARDTPAIEQFGRLTAREYRHGQGSPLAARYQRLLDESRTAVARGLPKLWELESTRLEQTSATRGSDTSVVSRTLQGAETLRERASRALRLLGDGKAGLEAHFYLACEKGLSLVTSHEAEGEPEGLREHLEEHLARELRACDGDTAVLADLPSSLTGVPATFLDERGRRYAPVSLVTNVDGRARYAGVVAFMVTEERAHLTDVGLAAAVGAFIDCGDTRGVSADDV
jgi:hypothetical protein